MSNIPSEEELKAVMMAACSKATFTATSASELWGAVLQALLAALPDIDLREDDISQMYAYKDFYEQLLAMRK